MQLGMLQIVKTERLENDPDRYGERVTATYPKWLPDAESRS